MSAWVLVDGAVIQVMCYGRIDAIRHAPSPPSFPSYDARLSNDRGDDPGSEDLEPERSRTDPVVAIAMPGERYDDGRCVVRSGTEPVGQVRLQPTYGICEDSGDAFSTSGHANVTGFVQSP